MNSTSKPRDTAVELTENEKRQRDVCRTAIKIYGTKDNTFSSVSYAYAVKQIYRMSEVLPLEIVERHLLGHPCVEQIDDEVWALVAKP